MSQPIKGSMTSGNPAKALIAFTLPLVCGNLFQQFYNIVDSIIVGKFVGEDALAAVGASTAITMLFVMVANGTGIGCSIIISNLFGAQDIRRMKSAISTALWSILAFSAVMSLLGLGINQGIMHLIGTPKNIFDDAAAYMRIYFMGFVFLFLYNAFSAIFNALGDSKKPLMFLFFSSVLNIGLDLLTVVHFGMGVRGVAWATLIAQASSAVLSFFFLLRKLRQMPCEPFARFDGTLLKRMVIVAIPTVLQQSIISVGMLLVQSVVNRFGSSFLAGYTAAIKLDSIAIVPMVAVGNAASTYVAQNLGAGRIDRIKHGYRICLAMAAGIALFIAVLMQLAGGTMIHWFLDNDSSARAIEVGTAYLRIVSGFYFLMGIMNVSCGILRGAADMKWFLAGSLVNLTVRVVLSYVLADVTSGYVIMWANPVGWGICLLIVAARYFQGGWKKKYLPSPECADAARTA